MLSGGPGGGVGGPGGGFGGFLLSSLSSGFATTFTTFTTLPHEKVIKQSLESQQKLSKTFFLINPFMG